MLGLHAIHGRPRRNLLIIALVAVLAAAAIGCGGDGGDPDPLTKAEFVRKGTEICAQGIGRIKTGVEALPREGDRGQKARTDELIKGVLVPAFEWEVSRLRSLSPPSADAEQVDKMLDTLERGIEETRDAPSGSVLSAEGKLPQGKAMVERYGLKGCMSLL